MRIIGVVDLLGGRAVHARAGQRQSYSPVATIAGARIESGDARADRGAARAAAAGAGAVIVTALARVGTGTGLDLGLIARVRAAAPRVTLLAGGGVRGLEDIVRLADAGCDGALVATALHDGRLSAAGVAAARALGRVRN